jgi:hypothetical protein
MPLAQSTSGSSAARTLPISRVERRVQARQQRARIGVSGGQER